MAQRPSHRLNLYLVPEDPDRSLDRDAAQRGLSMLRGAGVLSQWRAGPEADRLVEGGFALLRLDEPPLPAVYGNRQGGYYVRCPGCGVSLIQQAVQALSAWRAGGGRSTTCPSCGQARDLERLDTAPRAWPGRFALELRDVGAPELKPEHRPALEIALGGRFVVVGSRG